jgi:hypothetical protein
MIGADIPDADIIRHDHDDVGFLGGRLSRRHRAERQRKRHYRGREIAFLDHRVILPFAKSSGWSMDKRRDAIASLSFHRGGHETLLATQ